MYKVHILLYSNYKSDVIMILQHYYRLSAYNYPIKVKEYLKGKSYFLFAGMPEWSNGHVVNYI